MNARIEVSRIFIIISHSAHATNQRTFQSRRGNRFPTDTPSAAATGPHQPGSRAPPVKAVDGEALVEQEFCEVKADETSGSGDANPVHWLVFLLVTSFDATGKANDVLPKGRVIPLLADISTGQYRNRLFALCKIGQNLK